MLVGEAAFPVGYVPRRRDRARFFEFHVTWSRARNFEWREYIEDNFNASFGAHPLTISYSEIVTTQYIMQLLNKTVL